MGATYKGIELGKGYRQYSVVEVSELVALYIKTHSDSNGEWIGSIQSALNEMFGLDGGEYWRGRIRSIAKLIKYIGYRPGQDGNGNRIWRVSMEELLSGGVRVSKDIPTDLEAKGEKMGTGISDGLRQNIQDRKNAKMTCDVCQQEVTVLGRGPHMKQHYPEGENPSKVIKVLEEYGNPITNEEIAALMGWKPSKVQTATRALARKGYVERKKQGGKYFYSLIKREAKVEDKPVDGETSVKVVAKATKPVDKSNAKKVLLPDGVISIPVIETKDGTYYHMKDGKVYIVRLEEVTF